MRIVIIGNGVAGMEAAIAVREAEASWDITVISEESDHFFSRTAARLGAVLRRARPPISAPRPMTRHTNFASRAQSCMAAWHPNRP